MPSSPLDPDVADLAPVDPVLTAYDEQHVVTYLRLLDADAGKADWREVARNRSSHRSRTLSGARAQSVREPSGSRQMDDKSWLWPFAARLARRPIGQQSAD